MQSSAVDPDRGGLASWASVAVLWALLLGLPGCGGVRTGPTDAAPSAVLQGIGTLPGDDTSEALAVSGDGRVVVGASIGLNAIRQAFRWTSAGGLQSLGLLTGGSTSTARAASYDGAVIVGQADAAGFGAVSFRWAADEGLQQLPALSGASLCIASGVSGDSRLIVGTCLLAGNAGFRWTQASGITSLGQFGGGSSRSSTATAVSADGSTIVGAGDPVLTGAMAWASSGQARLLGHLAQGPTAVATAVSRDGSIIAGYSTDALGRVRAFVWTEATGMDLLGFGQEALDNVIPAGMSGDGAVVVGWASSSAGDTAVIWNAASGWSRLEDWLQTRYRTDLAGWTLLRATGISDQGRTLVGQGRNPQGRLEGWVLNLPDEGH